MLFECISHPVRMIDLDNLCTINPAVYISRFFFCANVAKLWYIDNVDPWSLMVNRIAGIGVRCDISIILYHDRA